MKKIYIIMMFFPVLMGAKDIGTSISNEKIQKLQVINDFHNLVDQADLNNIDFFNNLISNHCFGSEYLSNDNDSFECISQDSVGNIDLDEPDDQEIIKYAQMLDRCSSVGIKYATFGSLEAAEVFSENTDEDFNYCTVGGIGFLNSISSGSYLSNGDKMIINPSTKYQTKDPYIAGVSSNRSEYPDEIKKVLITRSNYNSKQDLKNDLKEKVGAEKFEKAFSDAAELFLNGYPLIYKKMLDPTAMFPRTVTKQPVLDMEIEKLNEMVSVCINDVPNLPKNGDLIRPVSASKHKEINDRLNRVASNFKVNIDYKSSYNLGKAGWEIEIESYSFDGELEGLKWPRSEVSMKNPSDAWHKFGSGSHKSYKTSPDYSTFSNSVLGRCLPGEGVEFDYFELKSDYKYIRSKNHIYTGLKKGLTFNQKALDFVRNDYVKSIYPKFKSLRCKVAEIPKNLFTESYKSQFIERPGLDGGASTYVTYYDGENGEVIVDGQEAGMQGVPGYICEY